MRLNPVATVALASLVLIGCAQDEPAVSASDVDVPGPQPTVTRDVLNLAKLEDLPEAVQQAFLREFPEAGITSIQQLTAATGRLLYEINFVRDGQAGDVVYDVDGRKLVQPATAEEF